MQRPVGLGQILHGDDFRAVRHAEQQDAAVHRPIDQPALHEASERYGAGAAVAFGAALLGAPLAFGEAEVIQQHGRRVDVIELDHPAAAKEAD